MIKLGSATVALRMFVREIRAGELTVLFTAVIIAVGSITAVRSFTERIDRGMSLQAAELLAADLILSHSAPINEERVTLAKALNLKVTRTLTMRSVVVKENRFQLVEAKAVGKGYPLRGNVRLSSVLFGDETVVRTVPAPGNAWIDTQLASLLNLSYGDIVQLGEAGLTVAGFITFEPDRAGQVFNIAPRIMFNLRDLPKTQLVQPGSRVKHRLLVAGSKSDLTLMKRKLSDDLRAGERIQTVDDGRPEMRVALNRARQFLELAALSAALLAGVSIALSAQRYARRHVDSAGLFRCFGASALEVTTIFLVQLILLGLCAGLAGLALGYAAQAVLVALLAELFLVGLPPPSLSAGLVGLAFGTMVLLGFGLPPLAKLGHIPPGRVLRLNHAKFSPGGAVANTAAAGCAVALILWFSGDLRLGLYVVGGSVVGGLVLASATALMVFSLRGLRSRVGVAWRFGLANISRRGGASTVQVIAFGLGLMALLLLAIIRSDLLETWQANLPTDTPNYFLINVQPDKAELIRSFLESRGLTEAAVYPMIRGRLSGINGRQVKGEDYPEGRPRRLATREFNLSYSDHLPKGNVLTRGSWMDFNHSDGSELSVEEGIARTLGFQLEDTLTFLVAGVPVTAKITSLRRVQWDSFEVNFFVLGSPAQLALHPATFITSFHLPKGQRDVLVELVRQFPAITVIDIDALVSKVRLLMDQATRGVEFVFLFTLAAGLSVLTAAIHATLDERRFESALIRTLGASRKRVWQGLLAEFFTLGALAGIIGAGGASAIGMVLATQIFDLPLHVNPWVWVLGVGAGGIGIGLAGLLGTRRVLLHPPTAALRSTNS